MTAPTALELQQVSQALAAHQVNEAIAQSEALADRGKLHPDLSFNRGLGYLMRAESPGAAPGDFGQAIFGFSETLALRPDDAEAARALEGATVELARSRSQAKAQELSPSEPLLERALLSASPIYATGIAALGALLLVLAALTWKSVVHRNRTIAAAVLGFIVWGFGLGIAASQLYLQEHTIYAIVVATRADVRDAQGRALRGVSGLPEGARVRIVGMNGRLAQIRTESGDLWLETAAVRKLPQP